MEILDKTGVSVLWSTIKDKFTLKSSLSKVATSGSYNDLSNKPAIPSVAGYLPLSGGTMTGGIGFSSIGDTATSSKITFNGSTDGADIYYQTTAADQGNLVLNLRDDDNCYLRIAKNGAFKSYFAPADGSFHGNVTGNLTGNVTGNVTGNAATATTATTATKLAVARAVSGGSDIRLNFSYDGSSNSSATIGFYSCNATVGNTNNYPYHRIAKLDTITGAYSDKATTLYITQDYNGGHFGIIRISLRTNNSSSVSSVEAKWLVRSGFSLDAIQVGIYNVYGQTYSDVFLKSNGSYAGTTVRAIASGNRGSIGSTWTLISSAEANDTTSSDKKTSTEVYNSIANAATALHEKAYSTIVTSVDSGTVNYANSAGSVAWANVTGKPSTYTPASHTHTLSQITDAGAAAGKNIRNLTTRSSCLWESAAEDAKYVPTMNTIAYWNGAYSTSGASNLTYCNKGEFGTIVTKNQGDYAAASHTHAWSSITGKPTMPTNITATAATIVSISGSTITVNASLDGYKTPGEYNIYGTSNGDYAKMYVQSGIADTFNGTRVITQTIRVTISHSTYAEVCDVTRQYKSNAWSAWTIMYLGND